MSKIVTVPAPVLTTTTKTVVKFDRKLSDLIKDMEATLNAQVNPQGVGLAAPQIGVSLSLFIIKPAPDTKTEAFLNPRIVKSEANNPEGYLGTKKTRKRTKLEGCLSIPKIWGTIGRATKVLIEYQDQQGKFQKKWFTGFKAVIIQHEVDHLNGILFTQRAIEQNSQLFEEEGGEMKKITGI